MTTPIKLYSKSSIERDWKCPRSYYWAYEHDGKGIQEQSKGLALHLGTALHDGLAVIAAKWKETGQVDIDVIAQAAYEQTFGPLYEAALADPKIEPSEKHVFASEQACLVEGLLRGFVKHVWPRLMRDYDIFAVEEAMVYKHGSIGMMVKPDLILKDKLTGDLWYFEYKSTSSKQDSWISSWATNIQLHSCVRAIQQDYPDESIGGVIIQGLYKGYISYGRQNSPFCYGYIKNGQPPFTKDQIAYEYRSGWKKIPVWEMEGGVKAWVNAMPDEILANQFPQTPPIFVNDDLIDAFFRQQEARQENIIGFSEGKWIHEDREHLMDSVFPQRFDQCSPSYGFECPYRRLCHGSNIDPIEAGYVYRDTEHLKPFYEALENE